MLLVTLVLLGVACLSCSAAPVPSSVEDQLQNLQQTVDQMQMEFNELKSANTIPKSGKQRFSFTKEIFCQETKFILFGV